MYSLVIPIYRNEASIPALLACVTDINRQMNGQLEANFVVDGSPDHCYDLLNEALQGVNFRARLLLLSRNFGSFPAIRVGLAAASGSYFAVMAADLQEPPSLIIEFFQALTDEDVDVVVGARSQRDDPLISRLGASIFWSVYRRFIQSDMPPGGVDVFGCNSHFRDQLLRLEETNSSLVGLIFWLGFRRRMIPYQRLRRHHGKSAWTFGRKLRYLTDSVFSFSDLPVRVLIAIGLLGLFASICLSVMVLIAKFSGLIPIPGYAATALLIMFFGALNVFGLGIVGSYTWRAYENTKRRPQAVPLLERVFSGDRET